MNQKFNPGHYPIVFKIIDGYLVMSSYEFGISIQKKFESIRKSEEIGNLYLDLVEKIDKEIKLRIKRKFQIPAPRALKTSLKMDLTRDKEKYLTIENVAKMLETSVDTVRRMSDAGEIKCKKTRGGHRRFKEETIRNFLEKEDL